MYICIYTHIYTYMCICIYVYVYTYIDCEDALAKAQWKGCIHTIISVYTKIHIHRYKCMDMNTYIYICIYIYIYNLRFHVPRRMATPVCASYLIGCIYIYICVCMYVHIYIYIHTYTYTYIYNLSFCVYRRMAMPVCASSPIENAAHAAAVARGGWKKGKRPSDERRCMAYNRVSLIPI